MLMKTMELSLKQIGTEIGVSLVVCFAMLPFSLAMGLIPMLLGMLVIFAMLIRGCSKIFGASIFGEEAGGLMTLPVTAEALIGGKLLAAVIWAMALGIGFGVLIGGMLLIDGSTAALESVLAEAVSDLLDGGAMPWQVGILMGMLPFTVCAGAVFMGLWMLTFQCLARRQKDGGEKGLLSRMGVKAMAAIAVLLYMAFNVAKNWLSEKIFGQVIGQFWMNAVLLILLIALMVIMYRFCRETLSRRCDFE